MTMYSVMGADGQRYGPVDIATLRAWVTEGRVTADTQVVLGPSGEAQPASALPELADLLSPPAPPPARPRASPLLVGLAAAAVVGLVIVGLPLAFVWAARAANPPSPVEPRGPATWNYRLWDEGDHAVLDMDGATVVFTDRRCRSVANGTVPLRGSDPWQGRRPGRDQPYEMYIRDDVLYIRLADRTVRVEQGGKRLVAGGQAFDLTGGKPLIVIRRDGSATTGVPTIAPDLPPASAYALVLETWRSDQEAAEHLVDEYVRRYPKDQPLAFFQAACIRSRFDLEGARETMTRAIALAPDTPQARCMQCVIALDPRVDVDRAFVDLQGLARQHPEDPVILWMLAVECRHLHRNEEGAQAYATLLKRAGPGGAMVHQTYANILTELGRHREALPHRFTACRLEPAKWSYEGLAITLRHLGYRHAASQVLLRSTETPPKPLSKPAAMVFSLRERQRLFDLDAALTARLLRAAGNQAISRNRPEFARFLKEHGVTEDQMMEIYAEGMEARWDLRHRRGPRSR